MLQPQFFKGTVGSLFAIYHPPIPSIPKHGAVLYVHPFAEELNKARRMAALQARRFAAQGFGVLLPDQYGCGDSGGDFVEARWEIWVEDLVRCMAWLRKRTDGPVYVWGLRAGALLSVEIARYGAAGLILWQPVANGEQMLIQFLRLRLAAGMMAGDKTTVTQLREALSAGQSLEVAGYELHPALAEALARKRLQDFPPTPGTRVDWFELVPQPDRSLSPASQRVVADWRSAGVSVNTQTVQGEPFWSTQEIALVPALLEATAACLHQ